MGSHIHVMVSSDTIVCHHEKSCLQWFANKEGADQPAHRHSLIIAFVIRLVESIISILAYAKFLASLCSCADWFESHFVENPEDRFSRVEDHIIDESKHYVTNQYHPEHYGLYPIAGK